MSVNTSSIIAGCVAGAAVSFLLTRAWVQSSSAALEKTLMGRVAAGLAAAPAAAAASPKTFPPVARAENQKRILITGGAGFVGSNLVDVLMQQVRARARPPPAAVGHLRWARLAVARAPLSLTAPSPPAPTPCRPVPAQGHIVYVMDNLFTGKRKNIEHWIGAWRVGMPGRLL